MLAFLARVVEFVVRELTASQIASRVDSASTVKLQKFSVLSSWTNNIKTFPLIYNKRD